MPRTSDEADPVLHARALSPALAPHLLGICLLAIPLLAAPLRAGDPAPADLLAAEKQLAAVTQQELAVARLQLNAASATLKSGLAAFEAGLSDGEPSGEPVADLLLAFQAEVADAVEEALHDTDDAADELLSQLELDGDAYPDGFYSGHGALADRTRESLQKSVDALYRKTRKRLRGTLKKADKAGLLLNVVLEPPPAQVLEPNNTGVQLVGVGRPLSVDVLVAWRLPAEEDGSLVAGGSANETHGDVAVVRTNGSSSFTDDAAVGEGRWSIEIPSQASNQLVHARQGTGSRVSLAIGLR